MDSMQISGEVTTRQAPAAQFPRLYPPLWVGCRVVCCLDASFRVNMMAEVLLRRSAHTEPLLQSFTQIAQTLPHKHTTEAAHLMQIQFLNIRTGHTITGDTSSKRHIPQALSKSPLPESLSTRTLALFGKPLIHWQDIEAYIKELKHKKPFLQHSIGPSGHSGDAINLYL